ncbi:transport protein SEC23-like [Pyrus ussuriensis x Pyrus communis]|uniref:Transport protein SEC23-like n=1 Tax=Pyrus ussuriensis x Pyrus communis TaxID=2448454 RepID=A0A5N5GWX9_9ROSA|nr:transport protein SEC23-like [Pyrus ussuriensis x Pyrus communis]
MGEELGEEALIGDGGVVGREVVGVKQKGQIQILATGMCATKEGVREDGHGGEWLDRSVDGGDWD